MGLAWGWHGVGMALAWLGPHGWHEMGGVGMRVGIEEGWHGVGIEGWHGVGMGLAWGWHGVYQLTSLLQSIE
jgi:hypothetical protein